MRSRPVPSEPLLSDAAPRSAMRDSVSEMLPAIIDGNETADRRVRKHVESCLRCQAELVQYRKLLKALRQLRTEVLEPSPGMLSTILAGLEEAGERGAIR